VRRYLKGYKFERWIRKRLEEHGWAVLRPAGSKPIDLVCFREGKRPLAIECRTGKLPSRREVEEAKEKWEKLGLRYIVVRKRKRRKKRR